MSSNKKADFTKKVDEIFGLEPEDKEEPTEETRDEEHAQEEPTKD